MLSHNAADLRTKHRQAYKKQTALCHEATRWQKKTTCCLCCCLTPGFLCTPNLTSAAWNFMLNVFWKMSQKIVPKVKKHWHIKYSTVKGHYYYKDTYCCNAVGNVVFAAGTKQLTFWEKKLTERTWGGDLFCLGCVWSPGESITCHLQTPLDFLHRGE